jgi:thiamine-monophosphate kinase
VNLLDEQINMTEMKLSALGEGKIISWITEFLGKPRGVPVPVGDDAAVVKIGARKLAVCSDMIQDGSHIYKGMTPFQAGRKVAVVNFSDLASMGAKPKGFLLDISISQDEEFTRFKDIFRGVESACQEAGAKFLGGDMNKGDKLILSGFAFGEVEKPMKRQGASIGDIVAVTGYLGSAACGWQILQKGLDLKCFSEEERDKIQKNIIKNCVEPRARVKEGLIMANSGYVSSCTDISDGLAFSLGYMRDGYGFEIYEDDIPIRKEVDLVCDKFELDKKLLKYHIGEDFELLCTVKPSKFRYLQEKVPSLRPIGKVVEGGKIKLVRGDGSVEIMKPTGYNHFSKM